ncbi:MAG TPA: phage protease, partial [Terriglobia bacterium]|nr:phage protease [Terriglobia bacterium]
RTAMIAPVNEELPRFISTLAATLASADEMVRVPLAVTGRWVRGAREFAITRADLESIARNFESRQNGEINVDYDHASEMPEVAAGGPIPSAGRIVRLDPPEVFRVSGHESRVPSPQPRFILWGWYEPTERARRLIGNREYRYISPAIDWTARSKSSGRPQGATLSTVALTNRPFLEEMPAIQLSDPEYRLVETGHDNNSPAPSARISDLRFEISEDHPISNGQFIADNISPNQSIDPHAGGTMNKVQLSVVDGNVKVIHEGQEFFADPAEVKACAQVLAGEAGPHTQDTSPTDEPIPLARTGAFLSEAEAAGKSVSALEIFRGEVDRELEDAVRTGKILPRRRDDWRRIALADLPAFRRIVADQKPLVPLKPVGFSGTAPEGAQIQVKLLAEQRMRERGISFGQALSEISREQPELAREYRRAVSGSE